MAYQGSYIVKNKSKYIGNFDNVVYRSLWERKVMEWCDLNPDVLQWSSEEVVVPYICKTDNQPHRYFLDFLIRFKTATVLVEVKPKYQVSPPVQKAGKRRETLLQESLTYAKNISKWEAATKYAKQRGWQFMIWTEDTLESMGIKVMKQHPNARLKKK